MEKRSPSAGEKQNCDPRMPVNNDDQKQDVNTQDEGATSEVDDGSAIVFDNRTAMGVALLPYSATSCTTSASAPAKTTVAESSGEISDIEAKKQKAKGSGDRRLPVGFKPSPYSVIIGRGKESRDHAVGDRRLRVLVSQLIPQYASAINRTSKSKIVSSVVTMVREACASETGGGAFVRLGKDGHWYEVDDSVAREKVGYTFREMLGDRYRSSSHSKVARKHQLREENQNQEKLQQQGGILPDQSDGAARTVDDDSANSSREGTTAMMTQIPPPGFLREDTPHTFFRNPPSKDKSKHKNDKT